MFLNQSQDNINENIESITEDPTAAFIDELQQKVSDKKDNVVSHIKSFRKQYKALVGDLNIELEVVRNTFILELENLTETADYITKVAEGNGRDVSDCNTDLLIKIEEANLKLDMLDLNLIDTNSTIKKLAKKIGSLSKEIGSYKKVMKNCKVKLSPASELGTNIEEADTCATDYIGSVDEKVDNVKQSVNDDITNVDAAVKDLISNVDNEVRILIIEMVEEFGGCVGNILA